MVTPAQRRVSAPKTALVEVLAPGSDPSLFGTELDQIRKALQRRGCTVVDMPQQDRAALLSSHDLAQTFVFGGLAAMWEWSAKMGCRSKLCPSYPSALDPFLNRSVRRIRWRDLDQNVLPSTRIFLKPVDMLFDGPMRRAPLITTYADAVKSMPATNPDREFLASDVVGWVSEYRAYVAQGHVLGVYPYRFLDVTHTPLDCSEIEEIMPEIRPSDAFLHAAIRSLDAAGQAPKAYALDVGLMAHGSMSVVEVNDALALSNYGLPPDAYLDLHLMRWRELVASDNRV